MARKLIDAMRIDFDEVDISGCTDVDDIISAVEDLIDAQPTVDAVPVVRCKDCKHWLKDVPGCTDNVGRCEWAGYMVGAAGYCVYGERKNNGEKAD